MRKRELIIEGQWLEREGAFFIWGITPQRAHYEPDDIRTLLFGWHAASFFGTLLEESERMIDGVRAAGLLVPAWTALDYWAAPEPLRFAELRWAAELGAAAEAAPLLRRALMHGWVAPDYGAWKAGRGWRARLRLPAAEAAAPAGSESSVIEAWLDHLIRHGGSAARLTAPGALRLAALLQAPPELPEAAGGSEDEWLVACGWQQDECPFRVVLRFSEPAGSAEPWTLSFLLRSSPDFARERRLDGTTPPEELPLPDSWLPYAEERLKRAAHRAAEALPWLADTEGQRLQKERLTDEEALRFLTEGLDRLEEAGIPYELPDWWEDVRRRSWSLRASMSAPSSGPSALSVNQLANFSLTVAIGDMELSEAELALIQERKQGMLRIQGRWIAVTGSQVRELKQTIKRLRGGMRIADALALEARASGAAVEESDTASFLRTDIRLDNQLLAYMTGLRERTFAIRRQPFGLLAELRPYQAVGSSWLHELSRSGMGGCLADDMGLGKTVQYIAFLLLRLEDGDPPAPALLICPTSVLGNWQKEVERFAPELSVYVHYGPSRAKGEAFVQAVRSARLVLTTYTTALMDEAECSSVEWSSLCLDEAQNIKNPHAKQSAAVKSIPAAHRIALTGTPVENRLSELWSIFDFINPGYLGSYSDFHKRYARLVEHQADEARTNELQQLLRPFLLRRVKSDPAIQLALPEKLEHIVYVELTAEQAALYEAVLADLFARIDRLPPMERRGLVLAAIVRLKQICNHPSLLLKDSPPLPHHAPDVGLDRSHKLARVVEMVQELRQENDRCLIFTQFTGMGKLLQHTLEQQLGEPVAFLHGSIPKPARDRIIADFQEPADLAKPAVLVLSLRAGGVGLNLTAASHVFHYDRWWNPAVENQATDRAYRIGQQRNVQVHKFVALGTLEERIHDMIERKQGLQHRVVGAGEQWITELSDDELKELLSLRSGWVQR